MKKLSLSLCLFVSACCTPQDLYISEVGSALQDRVRPSYAEALEATDWPEEIKKAKLDLLDQIIRSSNRIGEEADDGSE